MKNIKIDIMVNGGRTFYHSLSYPISHPLDNPPLRRVIDYVESNLPSLTQKENVILFIKTAKEDKRIDYTRNRKQRHGL